MDMVGYNFLRNRICIYIYIYITPSSINMYLNIYIFAYIKSGNINKTLKKYYLKGKEV